jgi:GPH family glycoside/pentoside/hexuronide:cation symporter
LGYASGNFGKSLQNTTVGLLYLYFLVDVLEMSAPLAGTILLLSQVWDAVSDLTLGHWVDRRVSSGRSYNTLILQALPFSALSFVAMFWLPHFAGAARHWWVLLACVLFRTAYTLVDIPHNSLLAVLSASSRKRSQLAALRFFFSSAGSLVVIVFAVPALTQQHDPHRFTTFAVSLMILYCVVMGGSVLVTPAVAPIRSTRLPNHFARALLDLSRNRRLMRVFLVSLLSAALLTVFSRMTVFYTKSWKAGTEVATWLLTAHFIGQILAAPLWSFIGTRLEKKTAAQAAHILMALVALVFLAAAPTTYQVAAFFYFFAGIALSGFTIMNWALVPDCIEYTEAQSGARHEAMTFGILTALSKVSAGIGAVFIGWALHFSGYDAPTGGKASMLLLAMTLPTVVGALACVFVLNTLAMSHAGHQAMKETSASWRP